MVIRVTEPERSAFILRKGEEGLSVFDEDSVDPPLAEKEVLESFRAGSVAIRLSVEEINAKGLKLEMIIGGETLPPRLRDSHAEIRPGSGMSRAAFKQALKELE